MGKNKGGGSNGNGNKIPESPNKASQSESPKKSSPLTLVASAAVGMLAAAAVMIPMLRDRSAAPPEPPIVPQPAPRKIVPRKIPRSPPPPSPSPPPQDEQGVPTVAVGVDVHSLDDILSRDEPCLITNLEPDAHARLMQTWTPDAMRGSVLGRADLTVRLTKGAKHSHVMRYSTRAGQPPGSPLMDQQMPGFAWPRHAYDNWDMTSGHTLDKSVLNPPRGRNMSASFSTDVEALKEAHPPGYEATQLLQEAICKMWEPGGCSKELDIGRLMWIASPYLGQQLHYDAFSNFFFHLYGTKELILVPPHAMVDTAHLFPWSHPAQRQSQIGWSSAVSSRRVSGFSSLEGSDVSRQGPTTYAQLLERRVVMRPGDVLYIPTHWGHQTFTGGDGPSVSYALWFFPYRSPSGTSPTPKELRDKLYSEVKQTAVNAVLGDNVGSAREAWAALRSLGRVVVSEVLGNEGKADALMTRWMEQRWRPQFGGLGVDADMPLQAEWLCVPSSGTGTTRVAAAKQIVAHMRKLTEWSPPSYQDAVMRGEVQDVLDYLITRFPRLFGGIQQRIDEEVKEAGYATMAEMVVGLVRSFSECT